MDGRLLGHRERVSELVHPGTSLGLQASPHGVAQALDDVDDLVAAERLEQSFDGQQGERLRRLQRNHTDRLSVDATPGALLHEGETRDHEVVEAAIYLLNNAT